MATCIGLARSTTLLPDNVRWGIGPEQGNEASLFVNIIHLVLALFMVDAIRRETQGVSPAPLLLLAIRTHTCRFVRLGSMPEAILMPTVAAAGLKITPAPAPEAHVASTPVRARAVRVGVQRRTLSKVLRRVALVRGLGERGGGALTRILRREATARLSHMVSLLVVKAHADRGAHEGGLVAAAAATEAAAPASSELRRAVVRRARPLLGRATVRRLLLGRHTVPVRRVLLLLELLRRLLGVVLRLLVSLRGVVRVVVLR
jgi:hypothetical protein